MHECSQRDNNPKKPMKGLKERKKFNLSPEEETKAIVQKKSSIIIPAQHPQTSKESFFPTVP